MPPTKAMTKQRGRIPEAPREPSPKEVLYNTTLEESRVLTLEEMTERYNALSEEEDKQAAVLGNIKTRLEALEYLIQRKIEATGADNLSVNGYTWTPKADAYASAEDSAALVKHFIDNGQAHLLSIHPARLTSMVREEIDEGTILIEPKEVVDPTTGETKTINEVRSSVLPGVKVFLKDSLGRVKSSRKQEKITA